MSITVLSSQLCELLVLTSGVVRAAAKQRWFPNVTSKMRVQLELLMRFYLLTFYLLATYLVGALARPPSLVHFYSIYLHLQNSDVIGLAEWNH